MAQISWKQISEELSGNGSLTGSLDVSGSINLNGEALGDQSINYITGSDTQSLSQIEVQDFDNNVGIDFTGGKLKFTFGTPTNPSSLNASLSGFLTNRFNKIEDSYTVNASWNNGGYNLISASLFEGTTKLAEVGSGTSLSYSATTSGSHTYTVQYTASSPLDSSLYNTTDTVTGTISKTEPGNPSISSTPTVQLGASSNQIEQGATGSIAFSTSYGSSNSWEQVSLSSSPENTPIQITGSATGSSTISITATAQYQSPSGDNDPQLNRTKTATTNYTKIRSLRHGAAADTAFTQSELENLANWDSTLGGSIGTIVKGDTNPSGNTITITWSGDKYHYIVFDSSRSNLSNITTNGFGVLGQFTVSTVGSYKVYRTNSLQAGGSGTSITYVLS